MASYTWEQKVRAVERYLSCGGRALDVIRELGYPGVCRVSAQVGARDGAGRPGGRAPASGARGVREALLEACASGAMTQTEAAGLAGVDPSARGTLEAQDVARGTGAGDA